MSLHWQAWSDRSTDPWVVEVLWWGYRIPFLSALPLSSDPIPFPAYTPSSILGKALEQEVLSLVEKGAVELAPLPSPGFYSRLFVVMKPLGSWRPVIDLSTQNQHVLKSPVSAPHGEAWLLAGVLRSQGCILAGSSTPGQQQVRQVRGFGEDIPVQSPFSRMRRTCLFI